MAQWGHNSYINIPFNNFVVVSLCDHLAVYGGCSVHGDDYWGDILECDDDIRLGQSVLNETMRTRCLIL